MEIDSYVCMYVCIDRYVSPHTSIQWGGAADRTGQSAEQPCEPSTQAALTTPKSPL